MKQKLSFILALVALSAAVSSCGDTEKTPSDSQALQTQTASITETTENARAKHTVPTDTLDFDGETFNLHVLDWQSYKYYFVAEEENGDIMNDAIYHRQQAVEDALNVKITHHFEEDVFQQLADIKNAVQADDDVYQYILLHCIYGVSSFSSEGFLHNLDTLPYVDIKADWWNQKQMDLLRLGNNTYFAVNDFMIPCPYVIFYNKEMVTNLDMENPYQLVYDGKWTIDAFQTMAKAAVSDINGDGKMDFNDAYGISANEVSKYISFVTGSNQYITEKDSSDHIQLALNTEKMASLVNIFADLAQNGIIYKPASMDPAEQLTLNSGRLMFTLAPVSEAEEMREYTVDFGFLPYPKYNEEQEDYISLDWGGLSCVPTTIKNPEMVGAVIELLAYESQNEVIPTYYNTILQGKLARDNDAIKMMDILFDTITYEIGGNYFGFDTGFQNLFFALPYLAIDSKSNAFGSYYTKNEKAANRTISSFYSALETVEGAQ